MLKQIYLSFFGVFIAVILNVLGWFTRPFMIYGFYNHVTKRFNKYARVSSTAVLSDKKNLDLGDHTWVWHHSIIDASNGVTIDEGCQIGAWVGIFSHGSHVAIRLLGREYMRVDKEDRLGYQRGSVKIGKYTFVGAHAIILPGVTIGKGCLIGAQSLVTKSVADFSIVSGSPAVVIGDTRKLDRKYLANEGIQSTYFDQDVVRHFLTEQGIKPAKDIGDSCKKASE